MQHATSSQFCRLVLLLTEKLNSGFFEKLAPCTPTMAHKSPKYPSVPFSLQEGVWDAVYTKKETRHHTYRMRHDALLNMFKASEQFAG